MGGIREFREEPGKEKTRSCRAQELARSSAQESEGQKKEACTRTQCGRDGGRLQTADVNGCSEKSDECSSRNRSRVDLFSEGP